ncbi:hypothetical protein [Aeromicrobium flavum]|nr:hypothetical protein [Aeromicrobium flavum]
MRRTALIAVLFAAGCGGPSDEELVEACPDLTRDMIEQRLGEPSAFEVTEFGVDTAHTEGSATVDGDSCWWGCGQGITKAGMVDIDVRDADRSSVIKEIVDLP